MRPKSMMPKTSSSNTGTTMANSTVAVPRSRRRGSRRRLTAPPQPVAADRSQSQQVTLRAVHVSLKTLLICPPKVKISVATTATMPTRMRAYSTVVTPLSRSRMASIALNLQYRLSMSDALPGQVTRTANKGSTAGWPLHGNSAEGAGLAEVRRAATFPVQRGVSVILQLSAGDYTDSGDRWIGSIVERG